MRFLSGFSALCFTGALSICFYLVQSPRPYPLVGVKFCPVTANLNKPTELDSQLKLNRKYCRTEYRMLKEVWEKKVFEKSYLPESSLVIRNIRPIETPFWWLLFSPVLAGVGYLSWARFTQDSEERCFKLLEDFKTRISLQTRDSELENEFKELVTEEHWRDASLKKGLIPIDQIQDKSRRAIQVQDGLHNATLANIEMERSGYQKQTAENLRDAAKADHEREKISNKTPQTESETVTEDAKHKERAQALKQALMNHEDGWLWQVIDNITPVWLIGKQGSGKSYTAAAIALVRKLVLGIPIYYLIDRHATGNKKKAWKFVEADNVAESTEEIEQAFNHLCEYWLLRIKGIDEAGNSINPTLEQVIVDEYTNLKAIVEESANNFYSFHLSDTRKAMSCVIGITHNDTNASYPENTQAMREAGTILIQKFSANGKTPLPRVCLVRGVVRDNGEEMIKENRTLPDWFDPEKIISHFLDKPLSF